MKLGQRRRRSTYWEYPIHWIQDPDRRLQQFIPSDDKSRGENEQTMTRTLLALPGDV